jgi:hypothetical protein
MICGSLQRLMNVTTAFFMVWQRRIFLRQDALKSLNNKIIFPGLRSPTPVVQLP